ncbi:hypothetical protein BC827DRAFT_887916 [Russula dissimulans]|nr:hypothetical protein BC827DRAFT_887916 [Russula dissimulans]
MTISTPTLQPLRTLPLVMVLCRVLSSHMLWVVLAMDFGSNEHPPTAGPYYSAMNHPNYPPQASYTSTTGHDKLPHTITVSCLSLDYPHATVIDVTSLKQLVEHRRNQTNHVDYYGPIASSPLQFEHYAPMAPVRVPLWLPCVHV